jgi:hypothetical protein
MSAGGQGRVGRPPTKLADLFGKFAPFLSSFLSSFPFSPPSSPVCPVVVGPRLLLVPQQRRIHGHGPPTPHITVHRGPPCHALGRLPQSRPPGPQLVHPPPWCHNPRLLLLQAYIPQQLDNAKVSLLSPSTLGRHYLRHQLIWSQQAYRHAEYVLQRPVCWTDAHSCLHVHSFPRFVAVPLLLWNRRFWHRYEPQHCDLPGWYLPVYLFVSCLLPRPPT